MPSSVRWNVRKWREGKVKVEAAAVASESSPPHPRRREIQALHVLVGASLVVEKRQMVLATEFA